MTTPAEVLAACPGWYTGHGEQLLQALADAGYAVVPQAQIEQLRSLVLFAYTNLATTQQMLTALLRDKEWARGALDQDGWPAGHPVEPCGAWGGCVLPKGHNQGRADIPENHVVSQLITERPTP